MDIPSFLATYGGPGGVVAVAAWFALTDRKFNAERRAELREDIDREQEENKELRAQLRQRDAEIAELRIRVHRCDGHCGGGVTDETT